ncbi:TetR/AcrR family transcriptional regulator [Nocardiopsis suaedae]|uniref:TetR/AcrR family transcriptional regulator n=1 Tax=Nocardiopsis suaedae TaxID=3018444 RepID=A0ABT4TJY3_9ACTN|nr:TetR/AcrR family transcriptional regulator [Nocardiopsis suaedae]MDA2804982.1 TetR/AcrR family transcriptional regulator [Nocardiopsis suaedae]
MDHPDGAGGGCTPLRSDAQRNRDRILDVALVELTRSPDVPLSAIAKKAGVGQGTFYRNFPSRGALVLEVYSHEMRQVADAAPKLLAELPPDRALRAWMDRLARFALAKAGLAEALSQALGGPGGLAKPGPGPLNEAIALLLRANDEAGTIRPGVLPEDFMLAITGLWHIGAGEDRKERIARLFDLVMDGLRAGAPSRRDAGG